MLDKTEFTHEVTETSRLKGAQYVDLTSNEIRENSIGRVLFTDEASLYVDSHVNRHNCQI